MTDQELFAMALRAREKAYCPYSHYSVGAALMLFRLRRKLGRIGFASTAVEVCKTLVAACAGAVVAMLVSNAVGGGSATGALLLRLVLSTGAGLVAYLILVVLFRVREVNTVTNLIFGRFKRRKR